MYRGPERRKFIRIKVNFIVNYYVDHPFSLRRLMGIDKEYSGLMLDLSEEGMGILVDYNLPAETVLSINFVLINQNSLYDKLTKINLFGQVCYNLSLKKGEYRLGIHFIDIEEADKLKIRDFVCNRAVSNSS
ncbi:MAG: PilZ domain-containing protein [Candidatus Omnitrophica bacterium]|nr:PilZ domain-containing protein [Candidatus Omnitrophota bacterium]